MSVWSVLLPVLAGAAAIDLALASRLARRYLPAVARTPAGSVRGPLAWALAGLVRLYRAAWSGRNAGMCRFEPSCSAYALTAVRRHGGVRGGALALVRLLRCQPLSAGGYDPVPGTGHDPVPGEPPSVVNGGQPGGRPDVAATAPGVGSGTRAGSGVVRDQRGVTAGPARSRGTDVPAHTGAAASAHRRGFSSPATGTRAEIVGPGRGPWA
ncbi:putative membrane protein insertion efficiency factor [Frankia canadensis]|uniref:Putative membrane protein insertion efficiency factor n=1 Tax=Frankia canadensis TaxID=1836972 RepID=A0A2I2L0I5_9ACTN|nr:membrane protein insertion efficiency factor YidD [Frankia canadensis]SNQ51425.1 putative membrane protein insertion efficiency factor [Frankia canadensis]SOU58715.1 putative membrane protein insertion efficiency factor [Frankia canadensis]